MVSWDEVRRHVRETLVLAADEPDRLALLWEYPNVEGVQRQYVLPLVAFARPHVVIAANVVAIESLSAHDALALNAQIPIGALCTADGYYVLRVVLPLEGVELAVIDRAIRDLAREATKLRTQAVAKPSPAPYFE
jgi:hypothetical protein